VAAVTISIARQPPLSFVDKKGQKPHGDWRPCHGGYVKFRAGIFGPATTRTQAWVGAVVAFALALVIGLGLKQGADSAVFTAGLIGVAVWMIGLQRVRRTRR